MRESLIFKKLQLLQNDFEGDISIDDATRLIYATDASAYREKPLAVARPRSEGDIVKLIALANETRTSLIPRAAGTSLAGQVVGNGIIVDISRYMTQIIELNAKEKWVRVQPGVILSELNKFLKPYRLFFGPETSTADYCMLGGMVGNNACGAHSLIYGSTRDHTLEIKAFLSDGSEAFFKEISKEEFDKKAKLSSLEGEIYRNINEILSLPENQTEIRKEYPHESLKRRNTGYAIDLLLETDPFSQGKESFNFCKMLAGSEGTLAFTTEIKLNLVPLPPNCKALVCVHFETIRQALEANLIALKHKPVAVELMDKLVMDLTKENIEQNKNRFFVQGDPGALLIVEFAEDNLETVNNKAAEMEADMREAGFGYHFPIITGSDIGKVWELRKAGLGVLNNMPGDAKPVPVIEDTAVNPAFLPDYIEDFDKVLAKYGKSCVYYAHIATGELHLRPVLNLKDPADVELFHTIALESAKLVKKYKGSLSGEHGDGRLRGEFIPMMIGEKNYALLRQIKSTWDPKGIFNPNKIVDTPKMNSSLRYDPGKKTREFKTVFDFSKDLGILRAAEKCNGTAVCRKTEVTGGTMCPSYMATRNENDSTRARANILREFLTNSEKANPFDHKEIYEVMDLCLSCKACKSECPSSVDVAKLKAEFLQHYYDANGAPFRSKLIANITSINKLGSFVPGLTNFFMTSRLLSPILMKSIGFAPSRSMPTLYKTTLDKWFTKTKADNKGGFTNGKVYLFNDEFTRFNDTEIGISTILLLTKLGFEVIIPQHIESGRTFLSKGFLRKAKKIANKNVSLLKDVITAESPLVGIEPSAILTFRDEYPDLVDEHLRKDAEKLAINSFTIEEFIHIAFKNSKIERSQFKQEEKEILYHGHCQQKSIASTKEALAILGIPSGWKAKEIPSGCCGMAGSFGYEKEHYEVSMKVGELVLFPAIRNANDKIQLAASGTSCRHQIKDGTSRKAKHPVELLYDALK
ncbi:MAG: FAD-linked oxidase C-terminal domain-containing protein [Bacteroidales bacterium]|nr:FAD-linked oxidase C-terminal domain-containing protein [Bacteroidales bacterium]